MKTDLNVLIVEDDFFASKYLIEILKSLSFKRIFHVTNAMAAIKIAQTEKIDLVFMDINIEGPIDGIQCCHLLNKEYFIPIIFTTAYGDSETIKEAISENIFGYLIKPFESHDVEAVLRVSSKFLVNNNNKSNETINKNLIKFVNNKTYNISKRTFFLENKPLNLTKKELDILDVFCNNINQNISYDTLKRSVWDNDSISNSTVRDTISRLRKKTGDINLQNVINYGYILLIDN